jgi:hypothetical protein
MKLLRRQFLHLTALAAALAAFPWIARATDSEISCLRRGPGIAAARVLCTLTSKRESAAGEIAAAMGWSLPYTLAG